MRFQKKILEDYARKNGYPNLRFYTDDGYSGVSFEKPGFQEMLADIEAGKVGTVTVKDMSWLGRNYLANTMHLDTLYLHLSSSHIVMSSFSSILISR